MKSKPLFITFEGGEGVGKTTLIESLRKQLESAGKKVLVTREPGGTPLGDEIRGLVLHAKQEIFPRAELLLFLAARAQHVDKIIKPALLEDTVVLCDRFSDSTIAYQGIARGFGAGAVRGLSLFASDALQPDLTFYLDLEPAVGLKRRQTATGALDRIEKEGDTFHKKVREAFLELAKQEPGRIQVLDASKSPKEVLTEALALIENYESEK